MIRYERAVNISVYAKRFRVVGIEEISPTVLSILACVQKALELLALRKSHHGRTMLLPIYSKLVFQKSR